MDPAELVEVGWVHAVLVDVVAAGQHAHRIHPVDFLGRRATAPKNPLDAGRPQLLAHPRPPRAERPDVDRPDELVDLGVLLPFLRQRFQQPDLRGVRPVAFAHRHVTARVEQAVANPPRRAEAALLRLPLGAEHQPAFKPGQPDRGVVRSLHDRKQRPLRIGHSIPTHAEAVAAVEVVAHFGKRRVVDRITDPLVDRQDEELARRGYKRRRVGEGRIHRALALDFDGEFRSIEQFDFDGEIPHGTRVEKLDPQAAGMGLGRQHGDRLRGPLRPSRGVAAVDDRQRGGLRVERDLEKVVLGLD